MPDDTPAWIEAGRRLKEDRLSRGKTLRQEAEARGLRPSELSRMERGIQRPVSGEPRSVYAVTTYHLDEAAEGRDRLQPRTVGLFASRESAVQCVEGNMGDLNEAGWYRWAVIEEVELGLYPCSAGTAAFYGFDRSNDKWVGLDSRPAELPDDLASFHTVG